MTAGSIIPMVVVPLTFLFVLLIILIVKAPKVGAWVVGGLVLLVPFLLYRCVMAGGFKNDEGVIIPMVVVPAAFLFVLLVILLAKAPRVGTGLIVAIVITVVLGLLLVPVLSHRAADAPEPPTAAALVMEAESTGHDTALVIVKDNQRVLPDLPGPDPLAPMPPAPVKPSPIWSAGIEREFEADVYPSQLAAARALGQRMARPIRTVAGDPNAALRVILFQEGNDRELISALRRAVEDELPGVQCSIEADLRNIQAGEAGLTLRQEGEIRGERRRDEGTSLTIVEPVEGGRIVATVFTENKRASAETDYIDKPWVESFGAFASARPDASFIVARSNGTCTSEGEARRQALDDAGARLSEALARQSGRRFAGLPEPAVTTMDVERGGFVTDSFVQSFAGSAGRIWRQALLIDVSGPKLAQLAGQKARELRSTRMSWARMGFSAIGVVVLIGVIYFFLNMATMGYYEWSLRIAGVVLAIVAIISILMIVQ